MAKTSSHAKTARRPAAAAAQNAPKRAIVTVSVEEDLLRRFDAMAKHEARTRSSQIALLMRRWVEGQRS